MLAQPRQQPPQEQPRPRVLIVDENERETDELRLVLSRRFICEVASSGVSGLAAFGSSPFDVIVASNLLTGMSALDLLDNVREQRPNIAFILIGDEAGVASVIEAGNHGASDYILRPIDEAALSKSVSRAVVKQQQQDDGTHSGAASVGLGGSSSKRVPSEPVIIGGSTRLAETLDAADRLAHSSAPVLLVGETGTGKELLARRIHARGPRRHRPYVIVNAGAIPSPLLDSELFGHVAGAFTHTTPARRGLIAEADGGTLFLDEVGDLPIEMQGGLLRMLESGAIRSMGAEHERHIDVRLIAATQRDLRCAVRDRTFREDLYFRLNALAIQVPPLRERTDDISSLIGYFFDSARARNPRSTVEEISPRAYELLLSYRWPGNVREVQGLVERLVVLGKGPRVEPADVMAWHTHRSQQSSELPTTTTATTTTPSSTATAPVDVVELPLGSLRDMTTRYVETVLASTGGDKARAAAILGIDVSTLYRWQRRRPE